MLTTEQVEIQLLLESGNFEAAIQKITMQAQTAGITMGSSVESGSTTATTAMSGMGIKGLAVWTALGAAAIKAGKETVEFATESVTAASDYNESLSKLQFVFDGISEKAESSANTLSNYGYSLSDATDILGSSGNLLTGTLSLTQEKSLELSEGLATRGADLASFTNYIGGAVGATEILNKALLGERESLAQLDLKISETSVQQKALEMGYASTTSEIDATAKALATYDLIMEQSANAAGDYERTQDSLANQTREFQNNVEDLKVKLGEKLLPVVEDVVSGINTLADDAFQSATDAANDYLDAMNQLDELNEKLAALAAANGDVETAEQEAADARAEAFLEYEDWLEKMSELQDDINDEQDTQSKAEEKIQKLQEEEDLLTSRRDLVLEQLGLENELDATQNQMNMKVEDEVGNLTTLSAVMADLSSVQGKRQGQEEKVQAALDNQLESAKEYASVMTTGAITELGDFKDTMDYVYYKMKDTVYETEMMEYIAKQLNTAFEEGALSEEGLNILLEDASATMTGFSEIAETAAENTDGITEGLEDAVSEAEKLQELVEQTNAALEAVRNNQEILDLFSSAEDKTIAISNATKILSKQLETTAQTLYGVNDPFEKWKDGVGASWSFQGLEDGVFSFYDSVKEVTETLEDGTEQTTEIVMENATYRIEQLELVYDALKTISESGGDMTEELTFIDDEGVERTKTYAEILQDMEKYYVGATDSLGEIASKYDTVMSAVENGVMTEAEGAQALYSTYQNNLATIRETEAAMKSNEEIEQDLLDAYEQAKSENEEIDELIKSQGVNTEGLSETVEALSGLISEIDSEAGETSDTLISLGTNIGDLIDSGGTDVSAWAGAISDVVALVSKLRSGFDEMTEAIEASLLQSEELLRQLGMINDEISEAEELDMDVNLDSYEDAVQQAADLFNGRYGNEFTIELDEDNFTITNTDALDDYRDGLEAIASEAQSFSDELATGISAADSRTERQIANEQAVISMYESGMISRAQYEDYIKKVRWGNQKDLAEQLQAYLEAQMTGYDHELDALNEVISANSELKDYRDGLGVSDDSQITVLEKQQNYLESLLASYEEGTDEYDETMQDIRENIEDQIELLTEELEETEGVIEQFELMAEIQQLQNELAEEQNDLIRERQGLFSDLTDEQQSVVDEIQRLVDLGELSTVNQNQVAEIIATLESTGISGLTLSEQLDALGIAGQTAVAAGHSTTIGTQNFYNATPSTLIAAQKAAAGDILGG